MMRLLDTETGQFVEFSDHFEVPYAILSHTWDTTRGEQTYQELRDIQKSFLPKRTPSIASNELSPTSMPEELWSQETFAVPLPEGISVPFPSHATSDIAPIWDHPDLSDKIRKACAVARDHGYRYIWIDFCCIDKTSSSELSEAINSMYAWYRDAAICYAFLADVPDRYAEDPGLWNDTFRNSRWFTRGWTLQELVAPRILAFLSKQWRVLGTKSTLLKAIESATHIEAAVLTHSRPLSSVSVATRMSWAARRETSRIEDQAYSLLGIFDIHMSTLYGEGSRAFMRLQEEILKRISDQSLFVWYPLRRGFIPPRDTGGSLEVKLHSSDVSWSTPFSPSIKLFRSSWSDPVRPIPHEVFLRRLGRSDIPIPEHAITTHGIRTQIPLIPIRDLFPKGSVTARDAGRSEWDWYFALLACESVADKDSLIAFVCGAKPSQSRPRPLQCASVEESGFSYDQVYLIALSSAEIARCRDRIQLEEVYLPLPPSKSWAYTEFATRTVPQRDFCMEFSGWAKTLLQMQGFEVRSPPADSFGPDHDWNRYWQGQWQWQYYSVELVKGAVAITIRCRYRTYTTFPGSSRHASIRLAVSEGHHGDDDRAVHPDASKTFSKDGIDCNRRGYLIEGLRITLRNAAGDAVLAVLKLGIERVSQHWFHLHVEVVSDDVDPAPSRRPSTARRHVGHEKFGLGQVFRLGGSVAQ